MVAAPLKPGPARVVANPALAEVPGAQRQLDSAAAGAVAPRTRPRALAPAAVVAAGVVVVVAEPEEPDQPDDEQPDVEDAEPDHEDPPLGGHRLDATTMARLVEGVSRLAQAAGAARGAARLIRQLRSSRGCSAHT